jgi:hypothetical protein
MPEQVRIWTKPPVKEPTIPFEDLLKNLEIPETEKERLRTSTFHEKLRRAEYHRSGYLRHLSDDELHQRIGYMIANVTYVSSRNRYSTNNIYSHYWRDKIAHASEELAIRNCARPISSHVLNHLPSLGFAIPPHAALQHDPRHGTFFRYEVVAEFKALYYRRLRGAACKINQHAAS